MDNYDYVDAYLEFVPMLYEAASPSEYYKWEDAIINFYITGDVPLNQLANLAKRGLSPSVFFWLWGLQREHGDDYCTSWYEMKEVLRRRFALPLEPEKTILSCRGSSYMGASEFSCANSIKKAIFATKPLVSSKAIQKEDSQLFQQVDVPVVQAPVIHESDDYSIASGLDSSASPCESNTNDVSDGLSMMAQEVQCDGTIANVKGQRSSIFKSECSIKDKVCKLIIDGGSFTNVVSSDVFQALSLSTWRLSTPRYM